MIKIDVTFKVVTPMFMAGALQSSKAEIRAPSIKGVLRFWYRALNPKYDPGEEVRIFGGSKDKEGQAGFLLKITNTQGLAYQAKGDERWSKNPICYLGYGAITYNKNNKKFLTERPYIKEGGTFDVSFLIKDTLKKDEVNQLKKAIWGMTLLGGLGAKSRKGFGSIQIEKANGLEVGRLKKLPATYKELKESIRHLLESIPKNSGLPKYTAWSDKARCYIIPQDGKPLDALEWLASIILKYRVNRSKKGQNPNALQFAKGDKKLILDFKNSEKKLTHLPKRAYFGLPHNYFFSSDKSKVDIYPTIDGKPGRRASPVLFKIYEFETKKTCTLATYLPAKFLPDTAKLWISLNGKKTEEIPKSDDFSAVEMLLDKISEEGKGVLI